MKRELLIEFPYIKIESIMLFNNQVYINGTDEVDGFPPTKLQPLNIGEYRNLVTLYNSIMHRVYQIELEGEEKVRSFYVVYNKHQSTVYWVREDLNNLILDLKEMENIWTRKRELQKSIFEGYKEFLPIY